MDKSLHCMVFHFKCQEGAQNLIFCMKFENCFWQEYHDIGHMGLVLAIGSSSNHPYTFKEGYEALNQQWMSPLTVQYSISHAERVPKICFLREI